MSPLTVPNAIESFGLQRKATCSVLKGMSVRIAVSSNPAALGAVHCTRVYLQVPFKNEQKIERKPVLHLLVVLLISAAT